LRATAVQTSCKTSKWRLLRNGTTTSMWKNLVSINLLNESINQTQIKGHESTCLWWMWTGVMRGSICGPYTTSLLLLYYWYPFVGQYSFLYWEKQLGLGVLLKESLKHGFWQDTNVWEDGAEQLGNAIHGILLIADSGRWGSCQPI
jgi:hypothetical protein